MRLIVKSEEEIRERIKWNNDCISMLNKQNIQVDLTKYKEAIEQLEWVLED